MKNSRKLLYSLYAAGIILGASTLTGCQTSNYSSDSACFWRSVGGFLTAVHF